MLEALGACPTGAVTGWVTVLSYVSSRNGYDRFQILSVVRDASGAGMAGR